MTFNSINVFNSDDDESDGKMGIADADGDWSSLDTSYEEESEWEAESIIEDEASKTFTIPKYQPNEATAVTTASETEDTTEPEPEPEEVEEVEEEETINSPTFIMNQKSLADKAPGAQQHSFAHRSISQESPRSTRLMQFVSIFMMCVFSGGLPFGLPALRQILVSEGVYGEYCDKGCRAEEDLKRVGCSMQEARLAVLQVTGVVTWMIGSWIAARAIQRLGPRQTGIMGSLLVMAGLLYLALSMPVDGAYWLPPAARMYILPVIVISIGSVFSFLACLHYIRLFPKRTSLLHSLIFLAQELSALVFYGMYVAVQYIPGRTFLLGVTAVMATQSLFWRFIFSSKKVPTLRFTVTTWHQRPLLVDRGLAQHLESPYFALILAFTVTAFLKIIFYMATFQVQLRILLLPTKRKITPNDFIYNADDHNFDGDAGSGAGGGSGGRGASSMSSSFAQNNSDVQDQFHSYIPFFAEQSGDNSSSFVSLRQFIYNPMQPEIFISDLQDMLYLLIPIASVMTIFWIRASIADRKISTALLNSLLSLIAWGFVQNIFTVRLQAFSAMIFPVFRSLFTGIVYEFCERIFGCQHFHFTFWFLWATCGVILACLLIPMVFFSIEHFEQYGLFERINTTMNILLIIVGFGVIWVLICNRL